MTVPCLHSLRRELSRNPEQRGQYNFREKLVLAMCEAASISTTKGTVIFDAEVISEENWTDGMKNIAAYSVFLGRELMGVEIKVQIVNTANTFVACYGKGQIHFNVQHLGFQWFDQGPTEAVDRLLIHEFGHQYSGDHLSEAYHGAPCRLGAGLERLALKNPEAFRQFVE